MNFYATALLNFAVYIYKLVITNNVSQWNCKLGIIHVFHITPRLWREFCSMQSLSDVLEPFEDCERLSNESKQSY